MRSRFIPEHGRLTGRRKRFRAIAPPMLARRMVVHLAKSPRKIELFGKAQLVADLFNRKVGAVQKLNRVLHPQVIAALNAK